jgi:hypothetical protein
MRDSIDAVNGIGHAAVACDPQFRAALAAHGYTLNESGEIEQLATFVGPFSKRAAQIGMLLDRYEAQWRADHLGEEPGPGLRRAWDARAWAEDRPDKIVPSRVSSCGSAGWMSWPGWLPGSRSVDPTRTADVRAT